VVVVVVLVVAMLVLMFVLMVVGVFMAVIVTVCMSVGVVIAVFVTVTMTVTVAMSMPMLVHSMVSLRLRHQRTILISLEIPTLDKVGNHKHTARSEALLQLLRRKCDIFDLSNRSPTTALTVVSGMPASRARVLYVDTMLGETSMPIVLVT
jgi:hypothetical protein